MITTVPTQNQGFPNRVAVITNRRDDVEHQVSLRSAECVCAALSKSFLHVQSFPHDIDLEHSLATWQPDVVFPVANGNTSGELQILLDSLRLAYVGSNATSCALCEGLLVAYQRVTDFLSSEPGTPLLHLGLAVPPFVALQCGDDLHSKVQAFCETFAKDGFLVVKTARKCRSEVVAFCRSPGNPNLTKDEVTFSINGPISRIRLETLVRQVEKTFSLDTTVLVQKVIVGSELSIGVLENPQATALSVIEVRRQGNLPAFEKMYSLSDSEYIFPTQLTKSTLRLLQESALALHSLFQCRDLSRIDFILASNLKSGSEKPRLWFLKAHTHPVLTETSLYMRAANAHAQNLSMLELVRRLVHQAWDRRC